ncbi:MAG: hypothetical protein WBA35_03385 [Litorimonas sp.]
MKKEISSRAEKKRDVELRLIKFMKDKKFTTVNIGDGNIRINNSTTAVPLTKDFIIGTIKKHVKDPVVSEKIIGELYGDKRKKVSRVYIKRSFL